jgi:hypothetical protein
LREALRLQPPAVARAVSLVKDTTIGGGKYSVKAGGVILILTWNAHRDTLAYGDDVRKFMVIFTSSLNIHLFIRRTNSDPNVCWTTSSKTYQYAHLIPTSYCPVSKHRFVSSPMLGSRSGMESLPVL